MGGFADTAAAAPREMLAATNGGDRMGTSWILIGMGFTAFAVNALLFALAATALAASFTP